METNKDLETRAILLTAARGLIADGANFSLKTLLTSTGVSRARFRRCFADKEQLLAALTGEDVKALGGILDVAQPVQLAEEQSLRAVVGGDVAPAPGLNPVVNDAWLERRLRVFERALAGLERRQEKSEQGLGLQLALIGEKLEALAAAAREIPAAQQSVATAAPQIAAPVPLQAEEIHSEEIAAPVGETAAEAASADATMESLTALGEPLAEPIARPITEKEKSDFLAHARRAAQNAAAAAEAAPPQRLKNLRWLAWSGAALLTLVFCTGVLFTSGALGRSKPEPLMAGSGVAHRHVAASGIAKIIALADSGDANAQTVLALDYLRGDGVSNDDVAARRWSFAAASQGQPVAQYLLGAIYQENKEDAGQAVRWLEAAAGQGNLKAMHNLAIAYAEGQGVEKNSSQAVQWFARAAEEGYRDSEFDLGVLYERGEGVQQSARLALKWYLIAAHRGDAPSAARAAALKNQVDPMAFKLAAADAAAFEPKPMGYFANTMPDL